MYNISNRLWNGLPLETMKGFGHLGQDISMCNREQFYSSKKAEMLILQAIFPANV